jgi:hypothetical protein
MSVNYTLLELEEALMDHPFGLTEAELWEYQQYYTDFWEDNVHSDTLQPLNELVEDFLSWLSDNDDHPFENKELVLKHLVESEI